MPAVLQFPFIFGVPVLPARRVIGIDPGTRCIRVVLVEEFARKVRIQRMEVIDLQTEAPHSRPEGDNPLKEVLEEIGDYPLALAVPQHMALSQVLHLPADDPAKFDVQIQSEIRKLGGLGDSLLAYDYARLASPEGPSNSFWITLCREADIMALLARLSLSRQSLCEVTSSANARLTAFLRTRPNPGPTLIVDIGAAVTQVVFVVRGQGVSASSIALGGDVFTEAIARGQRCSFEAAEMLKQAENMLGGDNDSPDLRAAVDEWRVELERLLDEWLADHPQRAVDRAAFQVILCGGGALLPGLLEHLNRLGTLRFDHWPEPADATLDVPGAYSIAYGAALHGLGRAAQDASLLPADLQRTWRTLQSTQWFQSISVLVLMGVMILLGFATWRQSQLLGRKEAALREGTAVLATALQAERLLSQLHGDFEKLRPVLERQRHTRDTLEALRHLQESATNRSLWFVLFGDEQSYLRAPLPTNLLTGSLTNLAAAPATNPPPYRRGFIAELTINEEGDALRSALSDVVKNLQSHKLFRKVDTLPTDQRRPLIDPKLVLAGRHFAVALELPPNEYAARPASLDAVPRPASPTNAPILGPPMPRPPRRTGPDAAADTAPPEE